jgi:hypothetical protein
MNSAAFVLPGFNRAVVRALLLIVALGIAGTAVSAQSSPAAPSTMQKCRGVSGRANGFVEQCGDKLRAWSLTLVDLKRKVENDIHGRFFFNCPIEFMCQDEPFIVGRLVDREAWQVSAKDERAIYEQANGLKYPMSPQPPMPPPACAPFDVSVAETAGRAVCFDQAGQKGWVLVIAADDRAAFLLSFSQRNLSGNVLKEKVLELLPRFKIERATGDAALLKWLR